MPSYQKHPDALNLQERKELPVSLAMRLRRRVVNSNTSFRGHIEEMKKRTHNLIHYTFALAIHSKHLLLILTTATIVELSATSGSSDRVLDLNVSTDSESKMQSNSQDSQRVDNNCNPSAHQIASSLNGGMGIQVCCFKVAACP